MPDTHPINNNPPTLRVLDIVEGTSVDGPGLRTSIYLAGCKHHCKNCHNPESWDFTGGSEMTIEQIIEVVERNGFNITLTGGDPIFQLNGMTSLCKEAHKLGYNIWCYTGYLWEELSNIPGMERIFPLIDVIVDGPYIDALRDPSLHFRGSSNQRIIDVKASLKAGSPILLPLSF